MGYRPSRKNPNLCDVCVEAAPPGGTTIEIGVLFADLRGFTSESELQTPQEVSAKLRRFYAHAEKVLFPEALIDKLIGDEVMALYVPPFIMRTSGEVDEHGRQHVAEVMLEHTRQLLERAGYGSSGEPDFAIGIGLDFGEAFIGNIGDTAVHDFTAVGDVVNTAARLQSHAAGGEVLISARLARLLPEPPGVPEVVELKGKQEPVDVRRVQVVRESPVATGREQVYGPRSGAPDLGSASSSRPTRSRHAPDALLCPCSRFAVRRIAIGRGSSPPSRRSAASSTSRPSATCARPWPP